MVAMAQICEAASCVDDAAACCKRLGCRGGKEAPSGAEQAEQDGRP